MRIDFRHGIISSQTAPFLFYNNSSGHVDLLANNAPLVLTVAHKSSNYVHSEDNTVPSAWTGPFSPSTSYWLYIEFDTRTFERSFGFTTEAPIAQATPPTSPTLETTWFNTDTVEQFRWVGENFARVNRVFIARLDNRIFTSVSQKSPAFIGTQIGSNQSVLAGRVMFSEFGNPITRLDTTFLTTEDQFFTNQSQIIGVRLESNVSTATALESLASFQIVALDINGRLRTAQYSDIQNNIIAVVTENLLAGEIGNIVIQGVVNNPHWNFSGLPAGTPLWVDNGALLNIDPSITNPSANPIPQVPVARILSINSIIFEQGLGGVGPVGPAGNIDNLPPATKFTLGAVVLKENPANPANPLVVTDNDPRLANAPFAKQSHIHEAITISVATTGNIPAGNLQEVLTELDARTTDTDDNFIAGDLEVEGSILAGGGLTLTNGDLTVSGGALFNDAVTLGVDPTAPFEAVTKRYVDNLTSGLRWLNPVCLANLIGDDLSTPTGLIPNNGDAYILSADGTGDWAGYSANDVVRWNDISSEWVNGGQLNSTNFPELRFLIAGNSTTAASLSLIHI